MPGPLTTYHGKAYRVVLGPSVLVEQRNGALMGTGMPSIGLANPANGEARIGLTVDIIEAPLKAGQVLVGGKEEGLRALVEAGVVRHAGGYYRSTRFDATFAVCDFLGLPEQGKSAMEGLREASGRAGRETATKDRDPGKER